MPKRPAEAPLGQSPPEVADAQMVDEDGFIAPRNSLEQNSNDPRAQSTGFNPQSLEEGRTRAEESEDVTMGNTGSKEQIEAFKSSLTSKLDAVKDGGRRHGDGGAGDAEGQEKQKDKDEERQQKKKRSEAEEGAGSGRYTMRY